MVDEGARRRLSATLINKLHVTMTARMWVGGRRHVWELIITIVGGVFSSFLGLFAALYLQRRTEREAEAKRLAVILTSVADELSDISASLKKYISRQQVVDRVILTPNLDALMHSGMLVELVEAAVYPYVIDAFSMITRLNEEKGSISDEERMGFMEEIINCSDNILFHTKQ